MKGLLIVLILMGSFLLLLVLAACKVSAAADAQAEEAFQKMMERRSLKRDAVPHKEAISDAGKE